MQSLPQCPLRRNPSHHITPPGRAAADQIHRLCVQPDTEAAVKSVAWKALVRLCVKHPAAVCDTGLVPRVALQLLMTAEAALASAVNVLAAKVRVTPACMSTTVCEPHAAAWAM
jgi:hypothetical protein